MRAAYHNFDQAVAATGCGSLPSAATNSPTPTSSAVSHPRPITDIVDCLLEASTEVVAASLGPDLGGGFNVYCRDGCAWSPVVDGALVRGTPLELARAGLTTYYLLLTTYCLLLTTYRLLLTTYRLPLTADYSLLAAYYLPLTAQCLLIMHH